MDSRLVESLPAILSISLIFGGGSFSRDHPDGGLQLAESPPQAEQNAVLKRTMLEKGFTAEQITKVIESGESPTDSGRN